MTVLLVGSCGRVSEASATASYGALIIVQSMYTSRLVIDHKGESLECLPIWWNGSRFPLPGSLPDMNRLNSLAAHRTRGELFCPEIPGSEIFAA